jgi:uncharacterized tellurite resistance protein B-like protein|tara:strand:- start:183 stop:584 length:402 start_codon:yes stop_codon:yes gene_type:complete
MDNTKHHNIKNAATILLYSVASADYNVEKEEIQNIKEIIEEFFSINQKESYELIKNSIKEFKNSTSFFKYGQILNENFSYQDKVDFICCVFEVAYSDNELHFKEQHLIKQISGILNIEKKDLIKSKLEIKKYL